MNIYNFNDSLVSVEKALKLFGLFRMRGIKSLNKDGVSSEFKYASIKEDYGLAYTTGLANYDYDFLLADQSYLQFEFRTTDKFLEARYAYFQNPITYVSYTDYLQRELTRLQMAETPEEIGMLFEEEYNQWLSEQNLVSNFTTLRYDVDFPNYKPLVHSVSHLHVGHMNNIRIPINKIISPLRFVLFTIKHVYIREWKERVEGGKEGILENFESCKTGELMLDGTKWINEEKLEIHLQ